MTILALDASSVSCSACVSENGKVLAEAFINTALTHSVTLLANIKKVLEQSEKTIEDIDLIAVTAGPGSFTGVKIGVACAKGLAFERDIPCFAVSSLAAAAENVSFFRHCHCRYGRAKKKFLQRRFQKRKTCLCGQAVVR